MSENITPNPKVPSQIVQELKFPKYINNLGIIPTSYKDSMSYYECLAWLCKYLEKTVIPTLNQNGKAVEELQNLYVELNQYVTNYFDNLDVQEEINNKLDDMVEAGTLQEIIADYLNSKAIFGYDTVADMKIATNLINGSYAKTLGYDSKNDGGGAFYKIRTKTTSDIINESTIIELNDSTIIAELIINDEMNVLQFGIKGNNSIYSNNLINALQKMQKKVLYLNNTNYIINNSLPLNNNTIIGKNSSITVSNSFSENNLITPTNDIVLKNIDFNGNLLTKFIIGSNQFNKLIAEGCIFRNNGKDLGSYNFALNGALHLNTKYVEMKNCIVTNNLSHGLKLQSEQNKSIALIENCTFSNNGSVVSGNQVVACGLVEYGMQNDNYDTCLISNCTAYGNSASGIAPHSINRVRVENCYSYENGEHGYCLMDGENGSIINCNSYNNGSYGIRIQGDYSSADPYYKNFIIQGCNLTEHNFVSISFHISNGIVSDNNFINITPNSTTLFKCMDAPNDRTEFNNVQIINNNFVNANGVTFFSSNNGTNVIKNIVNGKEVTGCNYYNNNASKVLTNFIVDNVSKKYGETNNILLSPNNFSSNWSIQGSVSGNTITPANGIIAVQQISEVDNPLHIGMILDFENSSGYSLSLGLRCRNSSNTLITFTDSDGSTFNTIAYTIVENSGHIGRIFDLSKYTRSDDIALIEYYLTTGGTNTTPITLNYALLSLTNELPIIPYNYK